MKQDEIIEMSEACGFTRTHSGEVRLWLCNTKDLEAFAKLIDAKATAKEREACAKLCERDAAAWGYDSNGASCAIAIRARGEA